jgi:hypothetical protein
MQIKTILAVGVSSAAFLSRAAVNLSVRTRRNNLG